MKVMRRLGAGLRALLRRNQVEQELDDELRQFLDHAIERNISGGMTVEEATRAARMQVGTFDNVKERVRDVGWESYIEAFWEDIQYAARRLAASPGFTIVAALTLGLGIGGNLAIFNLCYQVLIKPLPYQNPDQLVAIWGDASYRNVPKSETAPPDFRDWQRQATTFSDLAAYSYGSSLTWQAADSLANRRPRTLLITGFAAMTLILSILGVYSLVSFAVTDRTQEIGVRLALGASPPGIMQMFVKEGIALSAIGSAAGLIVSTALTKTLTAFLYGVEPTQPEFFAGVALLILCVAIVASYVPARRVRKIDPVTALRCE